LLFILSVVAVAAKEDRHEEIEEDYPKMSSNHFSPSF